MNYSMSTTNQCRICSAPAKYASFGVITCEPCRIFFRRNANKTLTCNFDNHCEVNIHTRHTCRLCRLKKCFQLGMTKKNFRCLKKSRRNISALVPQGRRDPLQKFPIINILQADHSLLTNDQWTLLSNLINCYKESHISSDVERLVIAHNDSFVNYERLVDRFLASVYETVEIYLCTNNDLRQLSFDDRAVILRSAADNVCCMSALFIMQYFHLYNLENLTNVLSKKYGKSAMDIHQWARKFIDQDIVLAKLAISLYAFSENICCHFPKIAKDFVSSIIAYKIQNKYAEVIWLYLLYRYDHPQAVQRFLNIILWLSSINVLTLHAQTLSNHLNDIYSVIEQTELALVLDDVDVSLETNHS